MLDRTELRNRYRDNRARSAKIFSLIDDGTYYERPIPLRHPFAFYDGHIPVFSYLVLNERGLGEPALDARLEKLFERGIDPGTLDDAQRHAREDWPTRKEIEALGLTIDARVEVAIASAKLDDPDVPRLLRAQGLHTALEHELMHQETLLYIVHRLPYDRKGKITQEHRDHTPPPNEWIAIGAGDATLGANRDRIDFGWDNEFDEHRIHVPGFAIQRYPTTNADWLRFVAAGGPAPPFWIRRGDDWALRGTFEELPLPLSWPVYVTHQQAAAFAAWLGLELPTEAQFHRAVFGTPEGAERAFPWGEAMPGPLHGNFDFARFDPEAVDAHPAGASAWGLEDSIGNGWEWTSSLFSPFPGFEPMASYPEYSTDFFDGKHYIMKGASPVTSRRLIRRSFRNWFYDDYPYMYAKFRCCRPSYGAAT